MRIPENQTIELKNVMKQFQLKLNRKINECRTVDGQEVLIKEVAKSWGVPLSTFDHWRAGNTLPLIDRMVDVYNNTDGAIDLMALLQEATQDAYKERYKAAS